MAGEQSFHDQGFHTNFLHESRWTDDDVLYTRVTAQADIENLIDGAERPSPMDIRNLIHGPESPFSQPRAALLNSLLDQMRELSVA